MISISPRGRGRSGPSAITWARTGPLDTGAGAARARRSRVRVGRAAARLDVRDAGDRGADRPRPASTIGVDKLGWHLLTSTGQNYSASFLRDRSRADDGALGGRQAGKAPDFGSGSEGSTPSRPTRGDEGAHASVKDEIKIFAGNSNRPLAEAIARHVGVPLGRRRDRPLQRRRGAGRDHGERPRRRRLRDPVDLHARRTTT